MEDSKFKIYSLGIVAKDKPTGTDTITVMPIEHITDTKGDINQESDYESKAKDHKKVPNQTKSVSKNTIDAVWIPLGGSNRISSPDVIAGETVLIFTYADTNEFYWTTYLREPSIRRLEKVMYGFSNMSSGARTEAFDRETSYWFEVDTMNKYVKLHTSENDGEFTTYDFIINTKEGSVEIKDGVGNSVLMNSKEGTLTANLNNEVIINTPTTTINSPTITLNGNVTTTGTQTIKDLTTMQNGMVLSGGGNSAAAQLTGDLIMDGNLTMNGNSNINGNVTSTGTGNFAGGVN